MQASAAGDEQKHRETARGERTLRKIHGCGPGRVRGNRRFFQARLSGITQRAGSALGTFYTYFDSKEAVFQALVRDMSVQVRDHVAPAFKEDAIRCNRRRAAGPRSPFSVSSREHRAMYRIVDEAESSSRPAPILANIMKRRRLVLRRDWLPLETKGEIAGDLTDEAGWKSSPGRRWNCERIPGTSIFGLTSSGDSRVDPGREPASSQGYLCMNEGGDDAAGGSATPIAISQSAMD